jgi:hypothetical protein
MVFATDRWRCRAAGPAAKQGRHPIRCGQLAGPLTLVRVSSVSTWGAHWGSGSFLSTAVQRVVFDELLADRPSKGQRAQERR